MVKHKVPTFQIIQWYCHFKQKMVKQRNGTTAKSQCRMRVSIRVDDVSLQWLIKDDNYCRVSEI